MKQLFIKEGKISIEEVPSPVCQENGILVKNLYSLISSGTELSSVEKRKNIVKTVLENPENLKKAINFYKKQGISRTLDMAKTKLSELTSLGYSCVGEVLEVGKNINEFSKGDFVACAGSGYANHAEFVFVPKNLAVKIPEDVNLEDVAFTTVAGIALQGIRRAKVEIGENVGVIGLGLIGLLTVKMLKANGCKVFACDLDAERIKIAERNGAFASGVKNFVEFVEKKIPNGLDKVIIAASSETNKPLLLAIDVVRKKGKIVLVGDVKIEFPREMFYKKELDFLISTSYGAGRYDKSYEEEGIDYPYPYVRWTEKRNMESFLDLLSSGNLNLTDLRNQIFDISDAEEAFESLKSRKNIAVLLKYSDKKASKPVFEFPHKILDKEKINIALIGAGSFAKSVHLPNIEKLSSFNLMGICDNKGGNAVSLAKKYNCLFCTTDYKEILKNKDVDAVLISTRHKDHAKLTVESLENGKHVFVEKPMSLDQKELEEVVKAVTKHKRVYLVGFNRRFSSLAEKMKEFLGEGPMFIEYIIHAGKLKEDHWIYKEGGRIIGEFCHFIDFCRFLADSEIKEISADFIEGIGIKKGDNISCLIKFRNGSVANLIYTELGSNIVDKEKIIASSFNKTCILDDFKSLELFGHKKETIKLRVQDKGHLKELGYFSELIRGKAEKKLSLDEMIEVTESTFKIQEMLKTR